MLKRKLEVPLLACLAGFLIFSIISTGPCGASSSVVYVSGDGSGDFICDGKDDQVQINQALEYAANNPGTTVYLKGPFVYDIRSSVLIGSNTELTGDSSAKLRLANRVGWTKAGAGTPMIGQIGGKGSAVHDIKIHGFEIDGNEGAQSGSGGKDLYRLISFQGSSNAPVSDISVYNMKLHDAKGEGFRCTFGKNIYYYNNVGYNLQHSVVMYTCVKGGEIHDNVANQLCNAADRLDSCQNIIIANEKISPYRGVTTYSKNSQGYAMSDVGIQIGNAASSWPTSNIVVRNCNIMSGVNGFWLDSINDRSNVNIYNNVIRDSGYEHEGVSRNGGIGITRCGNGITIQNNDIIGSYVAGINVNSAASGTRTVTVANNNIMKGKTGAAVKNSVPSRVKLTLKHNYIRDNPADFDPRSIAVTNPAGALNSKLATGTARLCSGSSAAEFYSYITSGFAPLPFKFIDTNQNSIEWIWNFGDGANSIKQDPIQTYSTARDLTSSMKMSNAVGKESIVYQRHISPGVQVPELLLIVVSIAAVFGLIAILGRRKL